MRRFTLMYDHSRGGTRKGVGCIAASTPFI
jgi:hypothetical protein